jgi:hypothetical protein
MNIAAIIIIIIEIIIKINLEVYCTYPYRHKYRKILGYQTMPSTHSNRKILCVSGLKAASDLQ